MIRSLARRMFAKPQRQLGYMYIALADDCPMQTAFVGEEVRVEGRGPPWLVVHDQLDKVSVTRWPGKLSSVEIVDVVTPKEQRDARSVISKSAGYTRCVAVKILDQLPASLLFGVDGHGEAVLRVIEKAVTLTKYEAEQLAKNRHRDASAVQTKIWTAWLHAKDRTEYDDEDLDGTLQISGAAGVSPVGYGLSVAHRGVFDRAREVDGDTATMSDDEDIWLVEPWSGADAALGDAALAFGASDFLSGDDRERLLASWVGVFGHDNAA